jgi:hypothetical protein
LDEAYRRETADMPADIYQTFLIQSASQPTTWCIMTHWRSQKDLDNMRRSTDIPLAVRMFQAAGAKPSLGIWKVVTHRVNTSSELFA